MPHRSALANYILDRLLERDETVDHFAHRVGVNASGLGRFLNGKTQSLHANTTRKVAAGLGLSPGEMISLAEREPTDLEHSESEAEVLSRVPELHEVIRDLPRQLWGPVLRFSIHSATEFARGLSLIHSEDITPNASPTKASITAAIEASKRSHRPIKPRQLAVA